MRGSSNEATTSAVSSSEAFLSIAAKSGADVDGAISTDYVLDPNNVDQAALPGAKLAKQILDQLGELEPAAE